MMNDIIKKSNKHYSPLRYPGGKSCLTNFFKEIIDSNKITNCTYVEPFAGGAGAALSLLLLEKVNNIIINDLDRAIYSFWYSIINYSKSFIQRIQSTELSIEEWYKQKNIYNNPNSDVFDLGFATFFLNRTNRSGIIGGGPIGGIKQDSKWLINARFNKENLIARINRISLYKGRINLTNIDGIDLMKSVCKKNNYLVYIDPPYYVKGSSLYLNHYKSENHINLSIFLNQHPDFYWILTYDNVDEIKNLYNKRRFKYFNLTYHADSPKKGKEIIIFSDKIIISDY